MPTIRLASETDFAGWREAARALRARQVAPEETLWTVDGSGDLFGEAAPPPAAGAPSFTVPKEFLELADTVVLHRSDERFALLYRLLWRLGREPDLLHIHSDPDVQKARLFARSVSQAAHKMKAFVRFRRVAGPDGAETYVAWFEPAHRVCEMTAPFFARRFAGMRFSILTPDACVHWDTEALAFTPGADPADAPGEDGLEDYWRTYYASIFNPARLKVDAMRKEMPGATGGTCRRPGSFQTSSPTRRPAPRTWSPRRPRRPPAAWCGPSCAATATPPTRAWRRRTWRRWPPACSSAAAATSTATRRKGCRGRGRATPG